MVMLALVVSIARMLTPVLSEQRDDIERWISQYSDQNIRISSMEAQWRGFSPRIVLKDVQLLDKRAVRTVVRFQEAQIGISIYESLKEKQLVPNSLKVIGVNIAFTRRLDGSLNIRGIAETNTKEAQQYSEILAQWLLRQKQLGIEKGDIYWNDEITGVKNMHFSNVALTIRNSETRHQFEGSVDLPKNLGSRLNFAADLQGNLLNPLDWQASLYIGGKQFQFAQWLGGSSLGNVSVQDGISDFQLWGEWQKGNLSRIEGKFATKNIKMTINSLQQSIAYTSARGAALWTREDTGWTLRVRDLDLQKGSQRWDNNDFYITSSRDGNQIDADFKFLPVKEVTSLLLASQLLDSDVDKILKTSQPEGELSDVKLHFAKDAKIENRLKFEARFEDLALNAWDNSNFP